MAGVGLSSSTFALTTHCSKRTASPAGNQDFRPIAPICRKQHVKCFATNGILVVY